jgi:hypothetical protein
LKNYWKLSIISRLEQWTSAEFYLKRNADAGSKDLKLSHQVATELNTSREVISRLLKKMEQRSQIASQSH